MPMAAGRSFSTPRRPVAHERRSDPRNAPRMGRARLGLYSPRPWSTAAMEARSRPSSGRGSPRTARRAYDGDRREVRRSLRRLHLHAQASHWSTTRSTPLDRTVFTDYPAASGRQGAVRRPRFAKWKWGSRGIRRAYTLRSCSLEVGRRRRPQDLRVHRQGRFRTILVCPSRYTPRPRAAALCLDVELLKNATAMDASRLSAVPNPLACLPRQTAISPFSGREWKPVFGSLRPHVRSLIRDDDNDADQVTNAPNKEAHIGKLTHVSPTSQGESTTSTPSDQPRFSERSGSGPYGESPSRRRSTTAPSSRTRRAVLRQDLRPITDWSAWRSTNA